MFLFWGFDLIAKSGSFQDSRNFNVGAEICDTFNLTKTVYVSICS